MRVPQYWLKINYKQVGFYQKAKACKLAHQVSGTYKQQLDQHGSNAFEYLSDQGIDHMIGILGKPIAYAIGDDRIE